MRRLGHGALIIALALTLAGCAGAGFAGPSCKSLNHLYAETVDDTQRNAPPDGFLRVPVVIHLMNNPDDAVDQRPGAFWTPPVVQKYFGTGNRSVNAVWARAMIHFDVTLVQVCRYTPPAGTFNPEGAHGIFPPDFQTLLSKTPGEQKTIINHYVLLNVAYGVSRTLNVYLWRAMHGANGYGESPRRGRPEIEEAGLEALSTVWYESHLPCGEIRPVDADECQLGVAHELGHALGLRHSCDMCNCSGDVCWAPRNYYYTCSANDPSPRQWPNWFRCEILPGQETVNTFTACGGELFECCGPQHDTLERLMYPLVIDVPRGGKTLCPGEVRSARRAVKEFFYD